jgi:hypothetical protein
MLSVNGAVVDRHTAVQELIRGGCVEVEQQGVFRRIIPAYRGVGGFLVTVADNNGIWMKTVARSHNPEFAIDLAEAHLRGRQGAYELLAPLMEPAQEPYDDWYKKRQICLEALNNLADRWQWDSFE